MDNEPQINSQPEEKQWVTWVLFLLKLNFTSAFVIYPPCSISFNFPRHKEAVWSKDMKCPPASFPTVALCSHPERDLSLNGRSSFSSTPSDRCWSFESQETSKGCRRKAGLGVMELLKILFLLWGPFMNSDLSQELLQPWDIYVNKISKVNHDKFSTFIVSVNRNNR